MHPGHLPRGPRHVPPPWPFRSLGHRRALSIAASLLALMLLALIVMVSGAKVARQDVGHVGVVRNGGPLDRRNIRQVLLPGQRLTWTGWFSQDPHEYPAAHVELLYTVTSDPGRGDRESVDVVTVPTRDGVHVGIEATVFYHFVGDRDIGLLRRFDSSFGTLRFRSAEGGRLKPWEGDSGFAAMMDNVFRPLLDNDLRQEIGRFRCEELIASCALLRRASRPEAVGEGRASSNVNLQLVERRLEQSLERDLAGTLEGPYFWDVHFRLAAVRLPPNVQQVINEVHAKYASVSGARADLDRARYEDARNRVLAKTYERSPALARINAIRSAPKGATIVLTDAGKTPGLNVGGG